MCSLFQQSLAEKGLVMKSNHSSLQGGSAVSSQSAKLKKLLKTTIQDMAQNVIPFTRTPGRDFYSKAKTGLCLCSIYTTQHERRQHGQQSDGLFQI